MRKTQVYLSDDDLAVLHRVARERRVPVAALIRQAIRKTWVRPPSAGPVGLWDGEIATGSADHDRVVYDAP